MSPSRLEYLVVLAGLVCLFAACVEDPLPETHIPDNPTNVVFERGGLSPELGQIDQLHVPAIEDDDPVVEEEDCTYATIAELVHEEGSPFAPTGDVSGQLERCVIPVHRGVAAQGMVLEAVLTANSDARLLHFMGSNANDYGAVDSRILPEDGPVSYRWIADRTGEFAFGIDAAYHDGSADYALSVSCIDMCDLAMTRYPIVLLHGMGGSDVILNLIEYFWGVKAELEEAGYDVYVTVVDPINSTYERASQLIPQLEEIFKETGARKLNLIGHSQGGLDCRAVVSQYGWGDRIASVTTIATPHRGSPMADLAAGAYDLTQIGQDVAEAAVDIYGWLLGREGDQDLGPIVHHLTDEYMIDVFNPENPIDPRVAYFSWNGHTCGAIEPDCSDEWDGEIVSPFLAPTYRALQLMGEPNNDGLVTLDSAMWGEFLGELPGDHLDEVGLLFGSGMRGLHHLDFFLSEAERLFEAGF